MQVIPVALSALTSASASTALLALGTAASVGGTVFSVMAARQQAAYQAEVAENNAKTAERNALLASENTQLQIMDQDFAAAQEMSALTTKQASSGFSLGSGSYALARKTQGQLAAQDRLRLRQSGQSTVNNLTQQAADFDASAGASRAAGANATTAGIFQVGSSLISGASKFNDMKTRSLVR